MHTIVRIIIITAIITSTITTILTIIRILCSLLISTITMMVLIIGIVVITQTTQTTLRIGAQHGAGAGLETRWQHNHRHGLVEVTHGRSRGEMSLQRLGQTAFSLRKQTRIVVTTTMVITNMTIISTSTSITSVIIIIVIVVVVVVVIVVQMRGSVWVGTAVTIVVAAVATMMLVGRGVAVRRLQGFDIECDGFVCATTATTTVVMMSIIMIISTTFIVVITIFVVTIFIAVIAIQLRKRRQHRLFVTTIFIVTQQLLSTNLSDFTIIGIGISRTFSIGSVFIGNIVEKSTSIIIVVAVLMERVGHRRPHVLRSSNAVSIISVITIIIIDMIKTTAIVIVVVVMGPQIWFIGKRVAVRYRHTRHFNHY